MPYLSGFFTINVVKGQNHFRGINCLSSHCQRKISPMFSLTHTWMLMSGKQHVLLRVGLVLAQ